MNNRAVWVTVVSFMISAVLASAVVAMYTMIRGGQMSEFRIAGNMLAAFVQCTGVFYLLLVAICLAKKSLRKFFILLFAMNIVVIILIQTAADTITNVYVIEDLLDQD